MSALWTGKAAAAATGGELRGNWQVSGVSIDSRETKPGDLFVALKDVRDGHDFVATALAAGASAALVSRIPDDVPADAPLLVVADVLAALEDLAQAARSRTAAKVIAITGSSGKTSTKEMLRAVLSRQGKTHAAERSFNNHWGVPLTLARMPEDTNFAVIEIGMNHPGEIAPLSVMAKPDVALITNVAPAHLAAFDDLSGIAIEKASIVSGLSSDGVLVACLDVDETALGVLQSQTASVRNQIWYGAGPSADWQLAAFRQLSEQSVTQVEAARFGSLMIKLRAPGQHFAINALGVLAAVDALGADVIVASHDLGNWEPPAGRGKREQIVLDIVHDEMVVDLFDDAFNANPLSMRAALEVLAATKPVHEIGRVTKGRRIAILGDMLELGPDEEELHRDIAQWKTIKKVDVLHTVGPRMRHLHTALKSKRRGQHFDDATSISAQVHKLVDAGDVVLVKGSKGSKVSLVVDAIRKLGQSQGPEEQEN